MTDWVHVANIDDVREGHGYDTGVEVGGEVVGVFLIDGQLYAVGECTHERGPISQGHRDGVLVNCPWHSAKFNVATGECVQGPIACRTSGSVSTAGSEEIELLDPLMVFDVRVVDREIHVRVRQSADC